MPSREGKVGPLRTKKAKASGALPRTQLGGFQRPPNPQLIASLAQALRAFSPQHAKTCYCKALSNIGPPQVKKHRYGPGSNPLLPNSDLILNLNIT